MNKKLYGLGWYNENKKLKVRIFYDVWAEQQIRDILKSRLDRFGDEGLVAVESEDDGEFWYEI